jgi:hypothetical protein
MNEEDDKIKQLLFSCCPANIELAFAIGQNTEEIALEEFQELFDFINLNPIYKNQQRFYNRFNIKDKLKYWLNRTSINVSNKKLKKLPKNIEVLKNLEVLFIHRNNLSELPINFENLSSLYKLNLCYNKFEKFPTVLLKMKNLQYLHLEGNKFSTEEKQKFQGMFPNALVTFDAF